jgi:KEOPS complex subunit Pcc1
MKHQAIFRFSTPHAADLYAAVGPEEEKIGGRSRARVHVEGETLVLDVEAADVPALRAALNMWLRLINVADEVREITQPAHDPVREESFR